MRKERALNITEIIAGLTISILLFLFAQIGAFAEVYSFTSGIVKDLRTSVFINFSDFGENFNFFFNIAQIKDERDNLHQEKITLLSENTRLKEELQNISAVNRQLQFDLPYNLEPVRVVGYNENVTGEIIINKGEQQGITQGEVVIFDQFAIGEIIESFRDTAKVRLITSPKSLVPVVDITTGTKGVVSGEVEVGLKMREILIDKLIDQGDTIVTAGINSNFPYGLVIGNVDEVIGEQTEITKEAKIKSAVKFNDLSVLFVINK